MWQRYHPIWVRMTVDLKMAQGATRKARQQEARWARENLANKHIVLCAQHTRLSAKIRVSF
jgi:hypothetical protein